ncbi:MAG: hypothetical protein WEB55_06790 [Acidimicrobiia bacterium]
MSSARVQTKNVPQWLRPWPWRVAAVAVALLIGAAVLAVLSRDLPVVESEGTWETRLVYPLLLMPTPVVGALIASRRPASWYGWVWLVLGLGGSLLEFSSGYVANHVAGASLPAAPYIALLSGLGWSGLFLTIPFVLLLFPTGHLPSPRWRHVARLTAACGVIGAVLGSFVPGEMGTAAIVSPLGVEGEAGALIEGAVVVATLVVLVMLVPAAVSLILRYRSAVGVERQQIKWFALAAALFVLMFMSDFVWEFEGAIEALKEAIPLALLPIAIGVAILRHRLYDIDRIISRTVSYAVLTALLVGVFVASVFLLRAVFPWEGDLPVAVSTLGVAALSNPLRVALQGAVDRRFNRSRFDAVATIEWFSRTVRTESDLPDVRELLLSVTARTMQPQHQGLWLKGGQRAHR